MPTILWTERREIATLIPDLPRIKAMNTDILFVYASADEFMATPNDIGQYLDECYKNGLKAFLDLRLYTGASLNYRGYIKWTEMDAMIAKYKDHPAVYGWYMDDESKESFYPCATRAEVYNHVRALDSNGMMIETQTTEQTQYFTASENGGYTPLGHDIFAIETYPWDGAIYNGSNSTTAINTVKTTLQGLLNQSNSRHISTTETRYLALMQAFTDNGAFKVPPVGGILQLWQAVKDAGWGGWGAGFFIFDSYNLGGIKNYSYMETEVTQVFAERTQQLYSTINSIIIEKSGNQFSATAYDSLSNIRPAVFRWSVNDETKATINAETGLLTPIAQGGNVTVTVTDYKDATKTQSMIVELSNTLSADATYTVIPATNTLSADATYTVTADTSTATPIELSVSIPINIPVSVGLNVTPVTAVELGVTISINIPVSVKMQIIDPNAQNKTNTTNYIWSKPFSLYVWKGVRRKLFEISDTLYLETQKDVWEEIRSEDGSNFSLEGSTYEYMTFDEKLLSSGLAGIDGHKLSAQIIPTQIGDCQKIIYTAIITPLDKDGNVDSSRHQVILKKKIYINVEDITKQ